MAADTDTYIYDDLCASAESKGHRLWHSGIWAIYAVHTLCLS
jgi:hypothetical protein